MNLHLTWFPFTKKAERKIRTQVHVFFKWRKKKGMSLSDYEEWLELFLNFTKKDDVLDVGAVDILAFLEYISEHHRGTPFKLHRAELAVRQFRRFYAARGSMIKDLADYNRILDMEGVNFVADVKRNKEIYQLWIAEQGLPQNKRKWSCRKLAARYNITYGRVHQILKREHTKYLISRAGGYQQVA